MTTSTLTKTTTRDNVPCRPTAPCATCQARLAAKEQQP